MGEIGMNDRKIAAAFKALGDENRIRILKMLQGGEKCACKLLEELSITQPTLSHHMKILCDAGIIAGRREGKWTHYSVNIEGAGKIEMLLHGLFSLEDVSQNCGRKEG